MNEIYPVLVVLWSYTWFKFLIVSIFVILVLNDLICVVGTRHVPDATDKYQYHITTRK